MGCWDVGMLGLWFGGIVAWWDVGDGGMLGWWGKDGGMAGEQDGGIEGWWPSGMMGWWDGGIVR